MVCGCNGKKRLTGNVMAHLMFQSCCYSWFVKGTWRVSYCAGKAREKLSCKCSATNISPFQGCLPSAASHFQDSVLKGKVPGQYCSTLVFSKAFHWVRYQIKTEDARIRVEHLEVLPKSQGGKHFSDSSPKKKKKSPRFVQRDMKNLSWSQNTSPQSTGAVRHP